MNMPERINSFKEQHHSPAMEQYLGIVDKILTEGKPKPNRTGTDTVAIAGVTFQHDMANGFPLLTTKSVPMRAVSSELEFFIKGLTDKTWLQERGNSIWDAWCNPQKVAYGYDTETKLRMSLEPDLGPIYGFQWRYFGAEYKGLNHDHSGEGVDQLADVVNRMKTDPTDRRMIVSAWNPTQLGQMALPPCHYQFQVDIIDEKVHLMWSQRSVDTMIGLPFNIASYGILLHLLTKEVNLYRENKGLDLFSEGLLTGFLGDTHIYVNHLEGAREQLKREPKNLPHAKTENFTSIFDWEYKDTKVLGYTPGPKIKFPIAV